MKRVGVLFVFMLLAASQVLVYAQEAQGTKPGTSLEAGSGQSAEGWKYMAAAVAVGLACIAGGIAVGQIGAAAMGAMSENPELSGKALPYVGLAEGLCLWGFLVALLILLLN